MAVFNDFLTVEGEDLLARTLAGECTLTFTKMTIGDGDNTKGKNITAVVNPKMTLNIYSVLKAGDNTVQITSVLNNSNLSNGFYLREKGVYATDGTNEVLMIYANCGSLAEWLEASTVTVIEKRMTTIITLADSDNANITLQSGLYATSDDIERVIKVVENNESSKEIINIIQELASTALSTIIWTDTRANKIDEIQDHLGYYNSVGTIYGQSYDENLHQKAADIIYCLLNVIKPLIDTIATQTKKIGTSNASVIKSVQRGTFYCDRSSSKTVNINEVNTSKSLVLVDDVGYTDTSSDKNGGLYISAFESSKITFSSTYYTANGTYSYQVIEFY